MTVKARTAAVVALLAVLMAALSGCQWLAEQTTPSFDPTPTTHGTPVETAQERQMRLDEEAAMKAYLVANKEADRLSMLGGANKPTKVLKATTGGDYQDVVMNTLKTFKVNGWRTDRPASNAVFADGGWNPGKVGLTACEDTSKVKFLDKKGKEVFKDRDNYYVQTLTATKVNGAWKITGIESKAVKNFEHEGNCAT